MNTTLSSYPFFKISHNYCDRSQNIMETKNQLNKNKHRLIIGAIACCVILVIIGLIFMLRSTISSSVYSERRELLGRLTESSASVINESLDYGQKIADIVVDSASHYMQHFADIDEYIVNVKEQSGYSDITFFFVDKNGKYYSSDGVNGKITETSYYISSSLDKLSYISTLPHMSPEKVYLIFRNRLAEPVEIITANGPVSLLYCGILFDIDNLNNTVSAEFAGSNNTFIYDDTTGVMLYKNFGIKLLLEGYNIYSKFDRCSYNYGESTADLIEKCKNSETVVVSIVIDGEEYYYCSAPIAPKTWSMAFIVQAKYLDEVSGNEFSKIILFISLIFIILGAAIVSFVVFFYKNIISSKLITEITELNSELEAATNAKSDFLSNMSHDIRTPINGIMGMTTIAKGVEGNPPKTAECLDKIDGASHHLLSLINDVLDMSRIERGKTVISLNNIDIRTVCDNCSSIIKGQMTGRELELDTVIECEHTRILGDDLHLRQIFINILGNAVKFTPDGGKIIFRCIEKGLDGDTVTLSFEIEDTGIGMKKEYLSKIFEPFTQDDGGARSKYKGTGLGMAITKQLTELMNGKIEVESELGVGSKFTVTIPFTRGEETEEEEEIVQADDLKDVKLLLVEDNEINMDIACELLSDAGAIISTAENGQEAVDIFESSIVGAFDAILMDVMMPVMNGLDSARAIRSLDRPDAKTIPIIAMTANAFESDIKATKDAGMNAHLSKPINITEVIKTTAYYVKKRSEN